MFDLKMKQTDGMCWPHTLSNGFSLQAEWILAELKIGGFLRRLETVAGEVRRGPTATAGALGLQRRGAEAAGSV